MAAMTTGSFAADDSALVAVKNTFIHFQEDSENEEESPRSQRRRLSVPPSVRLAGIVARKASTESEVSTIADSSSDESIAGDKESASPASTAANTPMVSPRQRKVNWADMEESWPLPPDPPPQSQCRVRSPVRTRLNAKAARWQPSAREGEQQLITRQVGHVMEQLQATLDFGVAPVKIEIHGAEMGQCCVVLWIRPADSWMTESLLIAAKEALLRVGQSDKVFVLGYQGRPFTPQMHGFSAMLTTVEEKTQACWELFKKGFCCRGTACRWQHPAMAYPVNVAVQLSPWMT